MRNDVAYHWPNLMNSQAVREQILKIISTLSLVLTMFMASWRADLASGQTLNFPKVSQKPTPNRPNVLFIYTDDQARWSIGAYGRPDTRTPNLDKLAREGAMFQNSFTTTPVCSPSRAGLMTGLYSTQVHIADWLNPATEPLAGLAPSYLIWPELLKANGYATSLAGKWHLGLEPQFHPSRSGFDQFYGFRGGGTVPQNPILEEDGEQAKKSGFVANLITDKTLEFVKKHQHETWLAAVHFREPHAPYLPADPVDVAAVADLKIELPDVSGLPKARVEKLRRDYLAAVHGVDRNVGRLLQLLDELHLTENTLVIFTSDHGYMIGEHGLIHKGNASWIVKGRKGLRPNMFDDAIRVPLIVRQPGRVPAGTKPDQVVSQLDLFPSILSWVGLGMPENLKIEGRDASLSFAGKSIPEWDETLFGQYDLKHSGTANMRMIRTRKWKLVRHLEAGSENELYDLANDPDEKVNLWGQKQAKEIQSEMNQRLIDKMKQLKDPLTEQISAKI